MKKSTKRVGIWIRVSTSMQAQGDSPEIHEKRARMYAELKGWDVVEIYHLEGVSGKTVLNHPETRRMMNDIRRGHIDTLIVSKLARLTRKTKEHLEFGEFFSEHKADLISLDENFDTSTPSGRLFFTLLSAMSQWEREEIAERVASSVKVRAQLGKNIGGQAPFGYTFDGDTLILSPSEAPVRTRMYELYIEHKRKRTVARLLNEEGHRTRKGAKFSGTTITRLLEDPIGKGMRVTNYTTARTGKRELKPESEWVIQNVPALITEEEWNNVQAILKANSNPMTRPRNQKLKLFTGYLVCHCGGKMYAPSNNPKYTCNNCKHKIPMDDIEHIFRDQLQEFVLSDNILEKIIDNGEGEIAQKTNLKSSMLKEISELETKINSLIELHGKGQLPTEAFAKHHDEPYNRMQELEAHLLILEDEINTLELNKTNVKKIVIEAQDIYSNWDSMEKENKRTIIESIVDVITIFPDTIEITIKRLTPSFQTSDRWVTNPQGFIAAIKTKFAGKSMVNLALEIVTIWSSIGWRITSSTCRLYSGNSSKNNTPLCASEISPG